MTDSNIDTVDMTETTVETISDIAQSSSIFTVEFMVKANEIANMMVAEAETARANGQKKIVTKSQIVAAIGNEFGITSLSNLDNVKGGSVYDTMKLMFDFAPGIKSLQGPYGGCQFGTKDPAVKNDKTAKKIAKVSAAVAKLSDVEKSTFLASLQPASVTEQPTV